jgi:hypothetical protein
VLGLHGPLAPDGFRISGVGFRVSGLGTLAADGPGPAGGAERDAAFPFF